MSARKVLEALFKSLQHCWGSGGSGELFEQLIGHSSSILSTEEDFNFIRRACTASMSLQAYHFMSRIDIVYTLICTVATTSSQQYNETY